MCFDLDSSPPIAPIHGGAVEHSNLVLTAVDGNRFAAFHARGGGGSGIVILPDVRGLFRFYEELALRFAELGHDAVAIDYFGRTAGVAKRDSDWDFWPEVEAMTIEGLTADVHAAVELLRADNPDRSVFIVGFCFGGSNAWHMAASDIPLSGVIGFYGNPTRVDWPVGAPAVIDRVTDFSCPVLALQAGDDPSIPVADDDAFSNAIARAGKTGEVVIYEGAPHSFFDRKQDEFGEASADAWGRIQAFVAQQV
ncbi:MAG: dienelactone hydrolase family protein [Acidimicrobiia bacterium]|nr:dienelactone hydrolase family protein [Acidimicrobiia bacterium]